VLSCFPCILPGADPLVSPHIDLSVVAKEGQPHNDAGPGARKQVPIPEAY